MVLDIVKTVLLPVIAGLLARLFLKKLVARVLPALPVASAVVISLIVAIVVPAAPTRSSPPAASSSSPWSCTTALAWAWATYLAGKLGRLDDKARRALAFEVGMQNSGLAATLATAHFSPLAALPSAVFSLWHNISGAIVAAWLAPPAAARRLIPAGTLRPRRFSHRVNSVALRDGHRALALRGRAGQEDEGTARHGREVELAHGRPVHN